MKELEDALRTTFEDFRLSKSEKYAFRELLLPYKNEDDKLAFIRNKAFDLAGEHMRKQESFDAGAYKWLEHVVKSIDVVRAADSVEEINEVYFSPGSDCKSRIISLIDDARDSVIVCVFTISDNQISEALYKAHKRGVEVRIITDNDKANDKGSDIELLIDRGLAVVKDRTSNHMHHKFSVIDQAYLVNGSFNWTRSASKYNNENITILTGPGLIEKFCRKFEEMWRDFGA